MKYPPAPLTPFTAALPQKPRHPFRCQLQPSRRAQGLSAAPSLACALLNSLVALFSAPVLYFQRLAHSFARTPGVWGIPNVLRDTGVGTLSLATRHSPLVTFLVVSFHALTNPSFCGIDKYAPPFHAVTNPSPRKPFLFTSIQNARVSTPRLFLATR